MIRHEKLDDSNPGYYSVYLRPYESQKSWDKPQVYWAHMHTFGREEMATKAVMVVNKGTMLTEYKVNVSFYYTISTSLTCSI